MSPGSGANDEGGPASNPDRASSGPVSSSPGGDADLRSHTASAATMWLTEGPAALSIWRGEVDAPDRLRIDTRDASIHELRLDKTGHILKLGRTAQVGNETNDLVYPDVASRLAATFRHDGTRWWIKRRDECSVPVQVGSRSLDRNKEAPVVHGVCVIVGGMRAVFSDRRYISASVPAGAVDPATGLLGRVGIEQEVAAAMRRGAGASLLLIRTAMPSAPAPPKSIDGTDYAPLHRLALDVHRALPSAPIGISDTTVVVLVGESASLPSAVQRVLSAAPSPPWVTGQWELTGEAANAGREIELALAAATSAAEKRASAGGAPGIIHLHDEAPVVEIATADMLGEAARSDKRAVLLFAIEGQAALAAVGSQVVRALEQELAAVVKTMSGPASVVGPVAPGVVAAVVPKKLDATTVGTDIQCDWHARPPILDGRAELPRALSWEVLATSGGSSGTAGPASTRSGSGDITSEITFRANELARECADPKGVLSSLSGGLPYPIAGRVSAALSAASGVERVKMLFDVLEGAWRFMAIVLASAYFVRRVEPGQRPIGFDGFADFAKRNATRDGFTLGVWRELARHGFKGIEDQTDAVASMAREVLGSQNQRFDSLSNVMLSARNSFAHESYNEAKAEKDLPEYEQMTRTLLRGLRPLSNWTLVTVERTEPDMYGEQQMVEFVDHTGPSAVATRRRIGLNSPIRLANVTYLARWREGLVLPLEPFLRRLSNEERFDLYWMDHLPRSGDCKMSTVMGGHSMKSGVDLRKLPPLMRLLVEQKG
ncbi:MAG: hypothetical protein U0414_34260 [Polyangiaceae bacterium]